MNLHESIRNDLKLFEDSVFAGFIAFYDDQKLEISKDKASDLWDAKKIAIAHFNIPKSKQGLLAVEPAYEEELAEADFGDDSEEQTTPEEYRVLETLANFRALYNQIKSVDAQGYAMDEYKERMLRDVYHDLIVGHFTKRSGKRQDIPDLDGSYYNHPID